MKPTARSSTADEVRDSPWRRTAPRRFPAMLTPWRPSSPGHFWSWTAAGSVASARSTTGSSSDLVRWREVAGFTALAYVIAWTVWAPLWPAALQSVVVGWTPSAYGGGSLAPVGMFAPALAALLMRLLFREGVRGSLGPLRRWRWSVLAALVPIAIVAATIAVATTSGLAVFHLGGTRPTWVVLMLLLLVGTPVSALLAFGEEYGWRSTAAGVTNRASAMPWLERPSAIRPSTSRSRPVSRSRGLAARRLPTIRCTTSGSS